VFPPKARCVSLTNAVISELLMSSMKYVSYLGNPGRRNAAESQRQPDAPAPEDPFP